jgi:hypothetical protein
LRDAEVRRRISALEERWQQSERQIAYLQSELSRQTEAQERAMAALEAEVVQLKATAGEMAAQAALPARVDRAEADIARVALDVAVVKQLRADIAALNEVVIQPRFGLLDSLIVPDFPRLFKEFRAKRWALLSHPPPSPTREIDSLIVSEFPPLFDEFRAKRFNLLWRDSFGAEEFRRRCDGRPDTLTLIVDTDGNVFGGFRSVKWESRVRNRKCNDGWKGDDSGWTSSSR